MKIKNTALTVAAGAALVFSSFSGYYAPKAEAALNDTKKIVKPHLSSELLSLSTSEQETQTLIVVSDGKKDITSSLIDLGAKVLQNQHKYVYLAEIPTEKVISVYNLDHVSAVSKNNIMKPVEKQDSDLKSNVGKDAAEVVKPATIETHKPTEVNTFKNKYDGTGTRISIIDTGIDPGHPAFQKTTSGKEKIVAVEDYTMQNVFYGDYVSDGEVYFDEQFDEGGSISTSESGTYNTTGIDAADDTYYFGELQYAADPEEAEDLNADGQKNDDQTEKFGVLLADGQIYVDKDLDNDFSDETPLAKDATDSFDVDPTDELPGANFRLNHFNKKFTPDITKPEENFPAINFFADTGGGHGTHVSGITAANSPEDAADDIYEADMDGVAPGAELVGQKVFRAGEGASSYSIMSAMVDAALPEKMGGYGSDVANLSLGSLPDINDGADAYNSLIDTLSAQFGITYVIAAGNDGPGLDTVGSPGTSENAISVGAYINSEMWETEYGYFPYGKDKDGKRKDGEGLWYFSSHGPREDGGQKPDIVAPGAAYSTYPVQQGSYTVLQGTSMASPYVTGVVSLLRNATTKDRVPYSYKTVREALIQTAKPLDGYNRAAQGAGLVNVQDAYDYLKDNFIKDMKTVDTTVNYGEKVSGGKGLYVRNKELPKEVTITLQNTSDVKKTLTLSHEADWFNLSQDQVTLEPGEGKTITATYDSSKLAMGYNDGLITVNDPSTPYAEARIPQTVVKPNEFTQNNHYRWDKTDQIQSSKTKSYFFDVKRGIDEVRFDLRALQENNGDYQGRVRMIVFDPDGKQVNEFKGYAGYGDDGLSVETNTYKSPKPGTWEVAVYGTASPKEDQTMNHFELKAMGQGMVKEPGILKLGLADGQKTLTKQVSFTNYFAKDKNVYLQAGEFSKPKVEEKRITAPSKDYYYKELNIKNNVSLDVRTYNPGVASDDVDLYVQKFNKEKGKYEDYAMSAGGSSDESVSFKGLADGKYRVAVFGFSGQINVDLMTKEVKVLDPGDDGEGSITVPKKMYNIPVSGNIKTDVKIVTPDDNQQYYAGIFVKDAQTDETITTLPVYLQDNSVTTVAGTNRIETSVAVSKQMYPDGIPNEVKKKSVVIATANNFPDALSAGPLADVMNAPILLTDSGEPLSDEVIKEIKRLGAENAFIVGGDGVVTDEVVDQLRDMGMDANDVERLSGDNRYETNRAVVNKLGSLGFGLNDSGVFVATGEKFADALSAGPFAGSKKMPIVLTKKNELPKGMEKVFNGRDVYVLGGEGVVSEDVQNKIEGMSKSTTRLAGTNRYGTLVEVLKEFANSTDTFYVSTGDKYPDALSSTPLVNSNDGVLLLTHPDNLPTEVNNYLQKYLYQNGVKHIVAIGGENAVSQEVKNELLKKLSAE
ncbi:cell wall-binding repeat-containing protein [Halobacillus rhizosphaerae]|uniref:cell wall-binding repeat-containing protein n=1 Tax=Halobacillus rhizosphaerae TaxID=3064889 RepID=UPI00398A6DA4